MSEDGVNERPQRAAAAEDEQPAEEQHHEDERQQPELPPRPHVRPQFEQNADHLHLKTADPSSTAAHPRDRSNMSEPRHRDAGGAPTLFQGPARRVQTVSPTDRTATPE